MKSAVILLALASVVYGGNAKFLVEVRLKIGWVGSQHLCNGALIDGDWVLVPAQCVQGKPWYGSLQVLLGSTSYGVRNITVHEKANSIANDIALVRLSSRVPFSNTVRPINLPFPEAEYTETATLYKLSSGTVKTYSVVLKSRVDCTGTPLPVSYNHICAGSQQNSAVKGDEGSPLAVSDGLSGDVLIGLLSFAKDEPEPAVYTKISSHTNWILAMQLAAEE